MCRKDWATTGHSLLFCEKIKDVWKGTRFWNKMKCNRTKPFVEIGVVIQTGFKREEYELWAILTWLVWRYVCQVLHGKDEDIEKVVESHGNELVENLPMVTLLGMKPGDTSWKNPKAGRFRVDVDAMFNKKQRRFGIGVIVRDANNEIILALARQTSPSSSVMKAEVMAIIDGIMLCIEHNIGPIEVYTDSFSAARLFANPDEDVELLPEDICDILDRVRDVLLIGVFHAYRSANRAAHFLAQFAEHVLSPTMWTRDFPTPLREIVLSESVGH